MRYLLVFLSGCLGTSVLGPGDSDTDAVTPTSSLAGCPPYSAVGPVGTSWSWASTPDYESGYGTSVEWTTTVDSVSADGDAVLLVLTSVEVDSEVGGEPYAEITSTYDQRCDEQGLALLATRSVLRDLTANPPEDHGIDVVYNVPFLRVPADLGPNGSWEYAYDATFTADDGSTSTSTDTLTMTSTTVGPVTTPIGAFDALATREGDSAFDLDPFVGRVTMSGFELTAYHFAE